MEKSKHYCNSCGEKIGFIEYMEQQSLCDECIDEIYNNAEENNN